MENKKLLTSLLIIVLAVVAVLVFIYLKNRPDEETVGQSSDTSQVSPPQQPTQDQPAVVGTQPPLSKNQSQGEKPAVQSNLTVDETAALVGSSGTSKLDSTQQFALATKVAKETGSINVTGCQIDPVVLKVKYQTSFTLKNNGTDQVSVVFYADKVTHSVPAGGQISIKADFSKQGSGLFGYYCRITSGAYPGLLLMYSS